MMFDDTKGKLAKPKPNEVAAKINNLHKEACVSMRTSLDKAIACGSLLVIQKKKCGHGNWEAWVKTNLDFDPSQAWRYMRCFYRKKEASNLASTQDMRGIEVIDDYARISSEPCREERKPVLTGTYASPLQLGGRAVPTIGVNQPLRTDAPEVPVQSEENRKRTWEHMAIACRFAQLGGISADELFQMLKDLLPDYGIITTNTNNGNK